MNNIDLRDWFAGQVLLACINNSDIFDAVAKVAAKSNVEIGEAISSYSYEMADAMMKAREVKKDE